MSVYSHDVPVSGPGRYCGRQALVRSLVSGSRSGRSFLVCGGPRLGRSSTLTHIAYLLELHYRREPGALKLVPVHFDLAPIGGRRIEVLLRDLWAAVVDAVLHPRVFGEAEPVRSPEVNFLRVADPWQAFADACSELWDRLSGTPGWCQWALLLEHGDLLVSQLESEIFRFAALLAGESPGYPSSAIVEGGRLLREGLFEVGAPLKRLRPMFLAVLRDAEAETLVRAGFPEADDAWVRAVLTTTGKHPYVMQRLLAQLEVLEAGTPVEDAIGLIQPDVTALFEAIWLELDLERGVTYRGAYAAPEHALLQYTLDLGGEMQLRDAERELGIKPLREYAELLEYLGVFERVLRANETVYLAPCQLFNGWYVERVLR